MKKILLTSVTCLLLFSCNQTQRRTIKAIRERMGKGEKKQFDEEMGMIID